jgi:hypothetical protein
VWVRREEVRPLLVKVRVVRLVHPQRAADTARHAPFNVRHKTLEFIEHQRMAIEREDCRGQEVPVGDIGGFAFVRDLVASRHWPIVRIKIEAA